MRHVLLPLATVLALVHIQESEGIVCFYCTIQPPNALSNKPAQLCSKFDYSNNYHVDCPYSTMCMKRTFEHTLQGGRKVKVSERGCAPQKKNEQVLRDGSWHSENKIASNAYRVGCEQGEGMGVRLPTEYCYCATNLCNSAKRPSRDHTDTMAVIVIFNILKYIESLR